MKKIYCLLAVITVTIALNSCQKFESLNNLSKYPGLEKTDPANVANDWYELQLRILLERNSALTGVNFGYIGIGLYESVRYGIKNSISLSKKLYQMPDMPGMENRKGYNWQVSANAAMAGMVRSFYKGLTPANITSIDSLENAYNQKLSPGQNSEVFSRSQAFGKSIATAIYNWYLTDDYNSSNVGYVPPVFPGAWVPTPPAFLNGISPYVANARPYLLEDKNTISPPFPFAYSEDPNSDFYNMVKNVYDVSQSLTPEQKNTALFWVDQGNGLGYTPDGHNIYVVVQALEQNNINLGLAAEAYAKAGIAERESTMVGYRTKYAYNILRPVTYIQKLIDPTWLSLIPTPPFPEYPANHALVTGAVVQAVAKVIGDNVGLTDHAYDFRGWSPRTYPTLFAAAEDAGISRLYGGIHYLVSIKEGLAMARKLGDRIGGIKLH